MKTIVLLISITFSFSFSYSQPHWTLTNGPESGDILYVRADSNIYFSAAWGGGIFRSLDNGNTWTNINLGINHQFVTDLNVDKGRIYVALQFGPLYVSNDSGNTWTPLGLGSSYTIVNSISADDSVIVLSTNLDSVRLSSNYGATWKRINYQFDNDSLKYPAVKDSFIFASVTGMGIYRLGLNDTNWVATNNGLTNLRTKEIKICGNKIFAGTGAGLFSSTNNGNLWIPVTNGISSNAILSLEVNGTWLVATDSTKEVFVSIDSGNTWTSYGIYPHDLSYHFATNGNSVICSTVDHGVMRTINNGNSWSVANTGLVASIVTELASTGTDLYALVGDRRIFKSPDLGNTWTEINPGWPSHYHFTHMAVDGNRIFVPTGAGIYITLNGGTTWSLVTNGLSTVSINEIVIDGLTIYAGTSNKGVYKSINGGVSWSPANAGITTKTINALCINGNELYAGTTSGLYKSTNGGNTWTNLDSVIGATIWVGEIKCSGNYVYIVVNNGAYFSTDNGISWNVLQNSNNANKIGISGNDFYYSIWYQGVKTAPLGQTSGFTYFNNGLSNLDIYCMASIGNTIFAGTYGGAVFAAQTISASVEEEANPSSELKLYPNPATEELHLQWTNHSFTADDIQITNLLGQKANAVPLHNDAVYTGNLTPGIYIISIRDNDEMVTRKFVKR